jgi:hypothetical protein
MVPQIVHGHVNFDFCSRLDARQAGWQRLAQWIGFDASENINAFFGNDGLPGQQEGA